MSLPNNKIINKLNYRRRKNKRSSFRNNLTFISPRDDQSDMLSSAKNDPLSKKERYQIEICQDGKLAVTFDTANLRIRVLDNTDHRQFGLSKKTTTSEHNTNNQNDQGEEEITKTIAYFKINENLDIAKFYDQYDTLCTNRETGIDVNDDTDKRYRWGLDISNIQNYYQDKYFIFIAVSRIDVSEDMKGKVNTDTNFDYKKNTIKKRYERINEDFRLDLTGTSYYSKSNETKKEQQNLDLNTRFDYPKSIENELQHWHKENLEDCMDKLLACLYDQYFLVEQYKNNVQALEVYDLADMSLKTTPKRVEKDKHGRKFNRNTFSVSKLQICFTRGINSVKLYLMENEATPITLENFSIADLGNRLARTSGNILHVDEVGKVTSVLKKIENKLNKNTPKDSKGIFEKYTHSKLGETPDRKADEKHTIHYDKGFEPIVIDKEPWVMDDWQIHGSNLASSP
ncbi:unnamed protein product [Rhizophagus irregularis]|nr:unnamed protein product [Rhizophagus irregularis]